MFKLQAKFSNRKSFYGKALVVTKPRGLELYSYMQHVATATHKDISGKYMDLTFTSKWDYSNTTVNHVREFVLQFMSKDWFKQNDLDPANITKASLKKVVPIKD